MQKIAIALLKLSHRERTILRALQSYKSSESVTHLAETADLPRTTTTFTLWSLERRGFAERIRVHNHHEWRVVHPERFQESPRALSNDISIEDSTSTRTCKGIENIANAIRIISGLSSGERVFSIQGNVSAAHGLTKLPRKYLTELHAALKDRQVIISGVVGESSIRLIKKMDIEELTSHLNRLVVTYVVPDRYLDFDCDVYVIRDTVLRVQYKTLTAQITKDQTFASAIRLLIEFMQDKGEKININGIIQKELASRA